MNITVEKLPECMAAIRVEVPRDKVETQRAQITKLYHASASVPGFRPGKAPAAMIARRYAKQIEQELRDRLVGEGYREGAKQEGLEIITPMQVKEPAFKDDGSFAFTVEVLVAPEFELPDYKGIPVKVPRAEITDANIDEAINALRERLAEYPDAEEGRALQAGDVAVINYHAFVDGRPIREIAANAPDQLQHGHDYWLMVKEPNFLEGFCDGLTGMTVGETKQVTVKLPGDFGVKELAGMDVTFEVELTAVKEQKLPELNDEFVQKTKIADDVAGLRPAIQERLQADLANRIEQIKREQIISFLNEKAAFELPKQLVGQAMQRRVNELVEANQKRGVSEDEIVEHKDEILSAANQQAQYDVKTNFLLNKVATLEEVEATPQEVQMELINSALRAGKGQKDILKLMKNEEVIQRFRENIIVRKTIELMSAAAVVEEVDPSAAETTESLATA